MKTISKVLFGAACLAGTVASTANAQDWGGMTATVALTSDYRFRGISQNNKEFTPSGGLTWNLPEGFYVSGWASKTNWGGNNPSFEVDIYGGKHFDLDGTDLNIMAYYYAYPDYKGPVTANFFEAIFQLTHAFGPVNVTATGAYSPQWSLGGGDGGYVSGLASFPLTDWLSISGTVGHQWVEFAPSDYTHWDFGATATYGKFALDARYVGNDIGTVNCAAFWMATAKACQDGFVATLTYTINPFE